MYILAAPTNRFFQPQRLWPTVKNAKNGDKLGNWFSWRSTFQKFAIQNFSIRRSAVLHARHQATCLIYNFEWGSIRALSAMDPRLNAWRSVTLLKWKHCTALGASTPHSRFHTYHEPYHMRLLAAKKMMIHCLVQVDSTAWVCTLRALRASVPLRCFLGVPLIDILWALVI